MWDALDKYYRHYSTHYTSSKTVRKVEESNLLICSISFLAERNTSL